MNPYFLPNRKENLLIQVIQNYHRGEFALIRMTSTMLEKSIMDASEMIRVLLRENNIVDYRYLPQQQKEYVDTDIILLDAVVQVRTSLYRPNTKKGDPRFWVAGLRKYVKVSDLLYISVFDGKLVVIPLVSNLRFKEAMVSYFGEDTEGQELFNTLISKLTIVKKMGWIQSVSPFKRNPKDVGDTIEKALGIKVNNLVSADYHGKVEIKAKRADEKTKDTLFCIVPDWELSKQKSATDVMLKYGYESRKHPGFMDLYVTVNNEPNNQGLYLGLDEEAQLITQKSNLNGLVEEVCVWRNDQVKERLLKKHPKTLWIVGEERVIDGKIHFRYSKMQLTERPIFSQFLTLISQGIITYDWRGRVKPNRKGYKDKGHCFRIFPSKRSLLFGDTRDLEI